MTSGQYSFGRRSYRGRIHRMQGYNKALKRFVARRVLKLDHFVLLYLRSLQNLVCRMNRVKDTPTRFQYKPGPGGILEQLPT